MEAATGFERKAQRGVHGDHVVFGVDAFVEVFKGQEFLLAEGGEAGALDAAQVAAGALDPEDFDGLAGEGVDFGDFGAGVAGEVGDAKIGAEEIGAIAKKAGLVERGGYAGVPAVFEKFKGRGSGLGHIHHFTGN